MFGFPASPLRLIALTGLLALAACQEQAAPTAKPARPVEVQRVAFGQNGTRRDFVGVVRARYETDLGFRGSSTSAIACAPARSWRRSIRRISGSKWRARKPSFRRPRRA